MNYYPWGKWPQSGVIYTRRGREIRPISKKGNTSPRPGQNAALAPSEAVPRCEGKNPGSLVEMGESNEVEMGDSGEVEMGDSREVSVAGTTEEDDPGSWSDTSSESLISVSTASSGEDGLDTWSYYSMDFEEEDDQFGVFEVVSSDGQSVARRDIRGPSRKLLDKSRPCSLQDIGRDRDISQIPGSSIMPGYSSERCDCLRRMLQTLGRERCMKLFEDFDESLNAFLRHHVLKEKLAGEICEEEKKAKALEDGIPLTQVDDSGDVFCSQTELSAFLLEVQQFEQLKNQFTRC